MKPWKNDTLAPNGRPIRDNFSEWFGGSRIVDALGEPLRVFHGTDFDLEIESFLVSREGDFGSGAYFADERSANEYGESGAVYPVFLRMERPYVTRGDYDYGERFDLDIASLEMVRDIFGPRRGITLVRTHNRLKFGREIEFALLARGHDGIIVEWPGCKPWYIVWDAAQIKSAIGNSGLYCRSSVSIADSVPKGPSASLLAAPSRSPPAPGADEPDEREWAALPRGSLRR